MVARIFLFLILSLVAGLSQQIAPIGPRQSSQNTLACCPASATYIATEGFEGVGAPSGWVTRGVPAADFDSIENPLAQSQSLRLTNGAIAIQKNWHSARSEVWYYFLWRRENTIDGASIMYVIDENENPQLYVYLVPTANTIRVGIGPSTHATTSESTSDGNTYHIWVHYKKGTGTDAVLEVHFSTTPTKPADGSGGHAKVTNGGSTIDATGVWFFSEYVGVDWRVDKVRADDEPIGSDPT